MDDYFQETGQFPKERRNRWNRNNRKRTNPYKNPRNKRNTQENSQSKSLFQRIGCRPPMNFARNINTMGARQDQQSNQTLSSPAMNMRTENVYNASLNHPFQMNNSSAPGQLLQIGLMSYLASKILEQFQSTHSTPKYDLSVQREIRYLQNKPPCPGGEVISSDGRGISCEITPHTTGISLNHRFSSLC